MDQTTATAEPTAQPSAPAAAPPSEPVEANPPAQASAPEAPSAPDWRALIEGIDPKELASHPKLSGLIGSQADRLARKRTEDWARQQQAAAEQERLRKLRDGDNPYEYVEEVRKQESQNQQAQQIIGTVASVLSEHLDELPQEISSKFKGRNYASFEDGLRTILRDLRTEILAHELPTAVEKEIAKRLPKEKEAWQKEWLAEQNGGEPPPDTTAGSPPRSPRRFTNEQIAAMSPKEYEQNRDAIYASLNL